MLRLNKHDILQLFEGEERKMHPRTQVANM